jgi:hypothetical protein
MLCKIQTFLESTFFLQFTHIICTQKKSRMNLIVFIVYKIKLHRLCSGENIFTVV